MLCETLRSYVVPDPEWAHNTISANIGRRIEKGKTNIHTYYIHYLVYLHFSVLKYNVHIFHRIQEYLHAIKKISFICFKQIMLFNGGGFLYLALPSTGPSYT
jgi:hypothetical protein